MTSYWDDWVNRINANTVTKMELIDLINKLHSFDHENKEILASKLKT